MASEAGTVVSSRLDSALAAFGRKQKKGTPSSSDPPPVTDDQAEQKRQASRRSHLLRTAPEHVRQKWEAICALRGRDRNKNTEKSKFTALILSDLTATLLDMCSGVAQARLKFDLKYNKIKIETLIENENC